MRLFALLSATDPVQGQRRTEIKELHVAPGQARKNLCPKQGTACDAPGFHQQAASSHSLNWQLPLTRSLDGTSITPEAVLACVPEALISPEAGEKKGKRMMTLKYLPS